MSVNYQGLINGNIGPIDIARMIERHYGGTNFCVILTHDPGYFRITFNEKFKGPETTPPWLRKTDGRCLSMWIDGACKGDYADVTDAPMTMVDLGRNGDSKEIIDGLVLSQGGWVKDEAKRPSPDEDPIWERLP